MKVVDRQQLDVDRAGRGEAVRTAAADENEKQNARGEYGTAPPEDHRTIILLLLIASARRTAFRAVWHRIDVVRQIGLEIA
jgi:hypothetical protein